MSTSPATAAGSEFFAGCDGDLMGDSAAAAAAAAAVTSSSSALHNGYSPSFASSVDKRTGSSYPPPPHHPMVQIPLSGTCSRMGPGVEPESSGDETAIKSEPKMTGLGRAFSALSNSQDLFDDYSSIY